MGRAGIVVGIFAILVGVAIAYAMLAVPEGLNPAYPVWVALLVPLAFVSGGLLICADALGRPALLAITFRTLATCLLVIVNWAAFFTAHIQCRETIAFLGLAIVERYPSEVDCRATLRIIMACIDACVLVLVTVWVWRRLASRQRESAK